ncbi:MAG: bifunctional phosphoribosyl-AMP cyclohydrolase/phosphoribosyl-ATP diphosphatase HisIE [Vicinamibacteria bacterium]|jgi:phosphoribosyl-ATP pyrophosphohydrolase/phosphoribosyl-AMP cyclohydrolase|nr:bifunctional phosphoribosyl-AMP cyclohydrolase/phosphoribosyl-ATP diphosphatase HisIE [Vicinamibacteria bacterium]
MSLSMPQNLKFDAQGLIPMIIQDRASGDVLMVAFGNEESLARTAASGCATFWSRSRGKLWMKGESSGHVLRVRDVRTDCDRDVLLVIVDPQGPTCHTNERTCFGDAAVTAAGLPAEIERELGAHPPAHPAASYTGALLNEGLDATLKKIGEQAAGFIVAAKDASDEAVVDEAADLLFHLLIALSQRRVGLVPVLDALRQRRERRREKPSAQ